MTSVRDVDGPKRRCFSVVVFHEKDRFKVRGRSIYDNFSVGLHLKPAPPLLILLRTGTRVLIPEYSCSYVIVTGFTNHPLQFSSLMSTNLSNIHFCMCVTFKVSFKFKSPGRHECIVPQLIH